MRYAFIEEQRASYPVTRLCTALSVSRQGYYAWRERPPSQRAQADARLIEKIKQVHQRSGRTYGSPRIQAELRATGIRCSRRRIGRLMRQAGLVTRCRRRRKPRTTRSNPHHFKYANRLQRCFDAAAPNRKWVADITYVDTAEGWLYTAGIMDLYSRKIVGLAFDTHMETDLVERALHMALTERRPPPGLLHHSDQGSQYTSWDYTSILEGHQATISMSRRGECLDNAPMESFWGTLKAECADARFATVAQAKAHLFAYTMGWYNRQRRHSALGYLSPEQYERQYTWTDSLSTKLPQGHSCHLTVQSKLS